MPSASLPDRSDRPSVGAEVGQAAVDLESVRIASLLIAFLLPQAFVLLMFLLSWLLR